MEPINVEIIKDKARFFSGNACTEWYKLYYKKSCQKGITISVGSVIVNNRLMPVQFRVDGSPRQIEILTLYN